MRSHFRGRSAVATASLLLLAGCSIGGGEADSAAPLSTTTSPSREAPTATESGSPTSTVADGTYVDAEGFSIAFPSTWRFQPDVAGLDVIGTPPVQLVPDFADNVGVFVEDTSNPGLTVEEYVEQSIQLVGPSGIPDFHLISSDVSGGVGTLEYTGTINRPLHFLAVVRVKDGKAFTATFTATADSYEAGVDEARAVLDTLQTT